MASNAPSFHSDASIEFDPGSVDAKLPSDDTITRRYKISNTAWRHHYNVKLADDQQIYRVRVSEFRPKKPDLTFHAGMDDSGPIVAVAKFQHFSRGIHIGLGDPQAPSEMVWEDLTGQSKSHSKYRWEMEVPTSTGPRRQSFLWKRTHHVGLEGHTWTRLSNRNYKLVDEQSGNILAMFMTNVASYKESGMLQLHVDHGQQFDLMVLATVLSLRVKCDELRPVCSNCSKRMSSCRYDSATSLLWTNDELRPRPRPNKSGSEGPRESESTFSTTANSLRILGKLNGDDEPQSVARLNLSNLELMMHWCNSTYKALSRHGITDAIWQARVPEEALSHPFLMHGLLALSAIHLARTRDEVKRAAYVSVAVAHENQALAFFREQLSDINASNAKAMFAFASVVVVYTFGFLHPSHAPGTDDPWACINGILQVFTLTRGVQQILNEATSTIRDSDWGALFQLDDYDDVLPDDERSALDRLHEVNHVCKGQDPAHDSTTYEHAIENLADLMAAAHQGVTSVRQACRWAIRLKAEFVQLLQEHQPLALIIVAYYCAILHRLRDIWFVDDWGIRVLKAIWQVLDDQWRPLLDLPMVGTFGDNSH
ncbi:Zn(II)2Cys6 transcription factor [Aspergillus fijiensis CBS 313.89]|uniref:C6 zinc finger domain protein n=1 Tax=Aspergillus fijiensis CBS 313.89 TaxID=1448319 RepID=A0A8G1VZ44_9EURO|nr:C6 zinc finger domain protein [Aspergillus fijiensis CBS 313.89]RAK77118.1 C6 zinc finger domain protein [Aspergillus fijiensis CBS 313.89]